MSGGPCVLHDLMTLRLTVFTLLILAAASNPAAAHLLVTEVGYDPLDETGATAEFVEILNPGPGSVSLANTWLVDDEEAYPLLVNGPVTSGITLQDFVYRFPAVTLPAGGLAVICHDSDAFLDAYFPATRMAGFFAQAGDQILLEITNDGSADSVPAMIDYGSNPAGTLSMANNGECIAVVSWNGVSDLVQDQDCVCWLTLTFIPNKDVDYPLGIDGPDPGFDESWFAEDLGTALAAPDAAEGSSIHRPSLVETAESVSGGNGAGGHDETSENWSGWTIGAFSPGVTSLPVVGVELVDAPSGLGFSCIAANPFRDRARVRATLPRSGFVRVTVHDLAGRFVASLFDGAAAAGPLEVTWDARDGAAGAGLFFVRLEFGGDSRTLRLVRLR